MLAKLISLTSTYFFTFEYKVLELLELYLGCMSVNYVVKKATNTVVFFIVDPLFCATI